MPLNCLFYPDAFGWNCSLLDLRRPVDGLILVC